MAALVAVVLILVGIKAAQIRSMINAGKSFAPPPESVTSAKVEASQWESSRSAVGTLVAVRAVTVASEVPGLVRRIGFDSGAVVRRGEVLVELDASTEQAQLTAAKADAELARATLERSRTLRASDYSSAAELDASDARAKQTVANVAMLQATIAKKTIRAPFDGRVAIRQVELGQVLSPGTLIASLQSIQPIHVGRPPWRTAERPLAKTSTATPAARGRKSLLSRTFNTCAVPMVLALSAASANARCTKARIPIPAAASTPPPNAALATCPVPPAWRRS